MPPEEPAVIHFSESTAPPVRSETPTAEPSHKTGPTEFQPPAPARPLLQALIFIASCLGHVSLLAITLLVALGVIPLQFWMLPTLLGVGAVSAIVTIWLLLERGRARRRDRAAGFDATGLEGIRTKVEGGKRIDPAEARYLLVVISGLWREVQRLRKDQRTAS
jgi:hypothetical protein